ncbi:hypothetical protein V9K67_19335 [Paraflavisolibacter sp. H34]|uniref:hypothetical protein n=1 Tax=Huijunlia imazamoxiresistens TaxID=3127457 RepID=UPI003015EBB2
MFYQLSKYLFQYNQVSIPGIGRFELVRQPARAEERGFAPPAYATRYAADGGPVAVVPEHQLVFLAGQLRTNTASAAQLLEDFGRQLENTLRKEPFYWNGIGKLELSANGLLFQPERLAPEGWQTVEAEKAVREAPAPAVPAETKNIQEQPVEMHTAKKQRPWLVIIAWILVFLCALALAFYFYQNGFFTPSAGNRQPIPAEAPGASYQKQ